jgi:hypothetical protein
MRALVVPQDLPAVAPAVDLLFKRLSAEGLSSPIGCDNPRGSLNEKGVERTCETCGRLFVFGIKGDSGSAGPSCRIGLFGLKCPGA